MARKYYTGHSKWRAVFIRTRRYVQCYSTQLFSLIHPVLCEEIDIHKEYYVAISVRESENCPSYNGTRIRFIKLIYLEKLYVYLISLCYLNSKSLANQSPLYRHILPFFDQFPLT